MSFVRVNPGGWVLNDPFTPAQMNQLDINVSRAADLTNGGTYSLASAIILNGAGVQIGSDGGSGLTLVRQTGPHTLAGSLATTAWRVDTSTLGNADHDITVAIDTYFNNVAPSAARTFTARHTLAGVIPVAGNIITVNNVGGGGFSSFIKREGGATTIVTFPTGPASCSIQFDGTAWRGFMASPGCTVGAGW